MKNNIKNLKQIYEDIVNDPNNLEFTKKGWKPIYSISEESKIIIIGQAPGIKAQTKEIAWDDLSGNKLRSWLGVTKEEFYDTSNFGLIPMDFYFPGKGTSGDLPPRKEVFDVYHKEILANLKDLKLIILIGNYSQSHYLNTKDNLTTNVMNYKKYLPKYLPLPHPSPRNIRWFLKNPFFEAEVLPKLKRIVKEVLKK